MTALLLLPALVLDAVMGDPPVLWSRLPHPVVLLGRLIGWLDRKLNRGARRRARGVLALVILLTVAGLVSAVPMLVPRGWVLEIALAAVLLAHHALVDHVRAVAVGLRQGLDRGRAAVSRIVGRDPAALDAAGVGRAAIESAAENFSDGLVAPAFWFAVGGLPGIVLYKAVNTADSMIGHRTECHREFGWAAARLDDLINLIPARLAGLLICLVGGGVRALRVMRRDAPHHRSPNSGWPEAAMAASLGVALAGPRTYSGEGTVVAPYINGSGRLDVTPDDIDAACALLWRTWAAVLALAAIAAGIVFLV